MKRVTSRELSEPGLLEIMRAKYGLIPDEDFLRAIDWHSLRFFDNPDYSVNMQKYIDVFGKRVAESPLNLKGFLNVKALTP